MAVNKIIYNGETLVDLTSDTVTASGRDLTTSWTRLIVITRRMSAAIPVPRCSTTPELMRRPSSVS